MIDSWNRFLQQRDARTAGGRVVSFGDMPSIHPTLTAAVFTPINWMGVIRVSGLDAANFLQALLTNDITDISPGETRIAGYCNSKGRLLAIFRILREGDDILLLSDVGILPGILKNLQMYVLRMKVKLVMDTERVAVGIVGPSAEHIVENIIGRVAETNDSVCYKNDMLSISVGGVENGHLMVASPTRIIESWNVIQNNTQLAGSDQWTLFEMRSGLARISSATQQSFIPQSVNLDLIGGISFSKGCYPGQEIVARVRYRGKQKYRMVPALFRKEAFPAPGESIFDDADLTRRVGMVVNSVKFPDNSGELLTTVPFQSSLNSKFWTSQTGQSIRLIG